MVTLTKPAKEVSITMTTADARLIVAALYIAQSTNSLGLSVDQANRAGIIVTAIHAAIWRSIRQSRVPGIPSVND